MTAMARFRAPNWTLNSNDSSPHSSLPLIFTPGALARAFGYSSALDLGPFYFKLRVGALFSCSQALNRADFEAEQQNPANFEPPTSNTIPELQINRQTSRRRLSSCSQALNRAADFQFRAAANFEPRISAPPNFKSSGKLLVDDLSDCSQLRIQPPQTSNQARFD